MDRIPLTFQLTKCMFFMGFNELLNNKKGETLDCDRETL